MSIQLERYMRQVSSIENLEEAYRKKQIPLADQQAHFDISVGSHMHTIKKNLEKCIEELNAYYRTAKDRGVTISLADKKNVEKTLRIALKKAALLNTRTKLGIPKNFKPKQQRKARVSTQTAPPPPFARPPVATAPAAQTMAPQSQTDRVEQLLSTTQRPIRPRTTAAPQQGRLTGGFFSRLRQAYKNAK